MDTSLQNHHDSAIAVAFLSLFIVTALYYNSSRTKRAPFAPGPKPRFLIGNLFDFPQDNAALKYVEWGKRFKSDILHASAFGEHLMILNSLKDAEELLDRRASKYSDRPVFAVTKLMGWDSNMAFMPLGDEWHKHRRLAQQSFRQDAMPSYYPIQLRKTHRMLKGLIETPDRFHYHGKMLSLSIPMSIMYGHDIESLDDPFIVAAEESAKNAFQLLQPGFTLINVFPFLQHIPTWMPGAVSQRMAHKTKKMADMLRISPMETVKEQLKAGTASPSLVANFLQGEDATKEDEEVVGGLAFTSYIGASDTTISATATFFYLMATHPEVQRRAQDEIDSVVGIDRFPTFEDRPSLPYIEAVYREVMRWRPSGLLGIGHRSAEDDVYQGYFIPKGTNVLANIWAMTHDEKKYPDPNAFKPERFLKPNGEINDDDRILAYGFGRRVCVGKHMASTTMWIMMASVIAALKISPAKDGEGHDIPINDDFYDSGLVTHKMPYKCSIVPRSKAAKVLIEEANTE